jgi:hypothetical protein
MNPPLQKISTDILNPILLITERLYLRKYHPVCCEWIQVKKEVIFLGGIKAKIRQALKKIHLDQTQRLSSSEGLSISDRYFRSV